MSPEEIIRFVSSFLGGGLVVAVGNWIHASRSARRDREIAWLQDQLRQLYGPLSFFTSQNEKLFELAGSVQQAHQATFTGQWSEDESRQRALEAMGEATTKLGNRYVERVVKNNAQVMTILETNWHLIDPADAEVFSTFQVNYMRY